MQALDLAELLVDGVKELEELPLLCGVEDGQVSPVQLPPYVFAMPPFWWSPRLCEIESLASLPG